MIYLSLLLGKFLHSYHAMVLSEVHMQLAWSKTSKVVKFISWHCCYESVVSIFKLMVQYTVIPACESQKQKKTKTFPEVMKTGHK